MHVLLYEPGPALWSIDELVREIGSRIDVHDSVWRLHRAGVIHRLDDGFVCASRAGTRTAAVLDPHSQTVCGPAGARG